MQQSDKKTLAFKYEFSICNHQATELQLTDDHISERLREGREGGWGKNVQRARGGLSLNLGPAVC